MSHLLRLWMQFRSGPTESVLRGSGMEDLIYEADDLGIHRSHDIVFARIVARKVARYHDQKGLV